MAINFLNTVNLNKNQLNQAALENLASDPATGVLGQVYYNTTDDEIKVCTTASTATPTNAVWDAVGSIETYTLPVSAGTAVAGYTVADIDLTAAGATTGIKSKVTFAGKDSNIAITETANNNGIVKIALTTDVTIDDNLSLGGEISQTGAGLENKFVSPLNMTSTKITSLANPTAAQDAATKAYVDTSVTGLLQFISGFDASTGAIVSGGNLTNGATRVAVAVGDYYVVTVAGDFFGNASTPLTPGDSVIVQTAALAGASSITDFIVVQSDTDLATDLIVGLGNVKKSVVESLEGISVAYSAGTASVGLDIQGLTYLSTSLVGADLNGFEIPIYNGEAATAVNEKIELADFVNVVNQNTSKSGIIDAGDLFGTVTHSFGQNTIVQTFDADTGETVFCDVVRGTTTPYTVTATVSAAYANDITILVQKINS